MARSFVLACFLFLLTLSAQTQVTLTGKLVDNKHNLPLGFTTIALLSAPDSTLLKEQMADSTGGFALIDVASGKYFLLFTSLGYQPLYKEIQVTAAPQRIMSLGTIYLTAAEGALNEVIVTGSKQPVFQRRAGALVVGVSGNPLFKTAANTLDILKKLPGLEVSGDGALLMQGRITPGVFIDDKPVVMSTEELQNYLLTLTPDMIASIELITNPSSQYDAAYKGIINIKLKPDLTMGFKGTITTNVQQNAHRLADNNLLLTYKTKKLAYTMRLGYTTGTTIRTYEALQHQASTNIMATNTKTLTGNNNFNYQLGIDYNFKKHQRFEMLLRTYNINRTLHSFNTLHTTDSSAKRIVSNTSSNNNTDLTQNNYAANLNYIARFGNKQLQLLTSLVKVSNRQREDIQNTNTITEQRLDHWKTALKNDVFIRTAQADLSGDYANGKWSTGAKFAFYTTKNDLHYDTLNTSNAFVTDSGRTNNFQYDEYISAAYFVYERNIKKLHLSAGLRLEHTHSIANAFTQKEITKRDYLTWLPGIDVTYNLQKNRQLHFSLTRRITRPSFSQLNPFRFYFSPLNYWVGNPYLLPSVTNALNASYSQRSFTVSITLGRETDPMTRYPEYDPVTNILQYLGRNLPYNDFANIETSFPLTINKWWRMSHNIGGYYKKEQTPYHNVTYSIPITYFSITGNQVFTLPKAFTFDLYYMYTSPGGDGLYTGKYISNIDVALQRTWLKGKLNTRINYYDVLNTYRVTRIFREKSIINNRLSHWFGVQRLAITLSYSFGTSTYKAKQAGKNEEESRAGF